MIAPGSGPLPGKCFQDLHGRCVMSTLPDCCEKSFCYVVKKIVVVPEVLWRRGNCGQRVQGLGNNLADRALVTVPV